MAAASDRNNWWMLLAFPALGGSRLSLSGEASWGFSWMLACTCCLVGMAMAVVCWASPGGPAWAGLGRSKKPIAGPRGWPIMGSIMVMTGLAHRKLASICAMQGPSAKRLMAFSIGRTPAIMSSHPDVAKDILNSSAFADRPIKESAYRLLFNRAMGFALYSPYWRFLRRTTATHLFSPARLAASQPHRQHAVSCALAGIDQSMAQHGQVRVRGYLTAASLTNIMKTVFGRSYDFLAPNADAETKEVLCMVREGYDLLGIFNWSDHFPLLHLFDFHGVRRCCDALVPRVNAFVQSIIDRHRHRAAGASAESESDFVDVLLSMQRCSGNAECNPPLSDTDMIAVLWEMIFRGTDTVAILLEWVLARVVMHADVQAKLHAEIDAVVGDGRKVTQEDTHKMEYLQAVVKEVLRMHPPGPLLSWARLAMEDVHVDGHLVPAGTTAMVNMWSITHDEQVWPDAAHFKPQRFLVNQGGQHVNVMGSDLRLAPFGSGRRVCPGKAMAMATTHLWLARLLHHFQWVPLSHAEVDLAEVLNLSCEMKHPLTVQALRRNPSVSF